MSNGPFSPVCIHHGYVQPCVVCGGYGTSRVKGDACAEAKQREWDESITRSLVRFSETARLMGLVRAFDEISAASQNIPPMHGMLFPEANYPAPFKLYGDPRRWENPGAVYHQLIREKRDQYELTPIPFLDEISKMKAFGEPVVIDSISKLEPAKDKEDVPRNRHERREQAALKRRRR